MAFALDDETAVSAQDAFNAQRDQPRQPQTNFTPPNVGYGDANQALNYGDNNAAPSGSGITFNASQYLDTSQVQDQRAGSSYWGGTDYVTPAPAANFTADHGSATAYDLNYGSANSADANNDGLNDQTGWANGVVQDFSSPSGFSYNGIPVTSDGAQYNPGPQQPQSEAGYNLNFASPFGGTANDAPVAPYVGDRIYQNPDTGGTTIHPGDQQFNPDMSYPAGSAYDAMANHPNGGPGFLDTLKGIPGDVIDWGQRVNARAADTQGSNFVQDFGNAASGNHLINVLSGKDPNELPGPLPYVTDVAASPMSLIPGPEGIGFASNYGRNILAGLAGSGASYGANEVLPEDMNPALRGVLVGGAGLLGGAAGYYAPEAASMGARGALKAADSLTNAYKGSPLASEEGSLNLGGILNPFKRKPTPGELPDIAPIEPMPKPADLGDSGIRAAIATKETTTREAGPIGEAVGKIPGVKKAAGVINPSINLERPIHVANQAEAAVKADISTRFAATRKPILDEIKASGLDGGANAPKYIGPAKNPIKNTFIDRVENPQDYQLTQPQRNLIQRIATRDAENVNLARGQYNADVGLYAPKNEGAAYVPHINANEDIIQRSAKAEAALTNPRIAKERVYDTARERAIASDKFKPETDPARLLEAHDNAIANMAGKETFKASAGGLNKAEAIAQVNPGLAKRYDALKTKLQSMKGTASRLDDRTSNAIDTFLKSGQTEEDMAALRESLHPIVGKNAVGKVGPNFGKDKAALNRDITQVKQQIDAIRPAWKNFNLQEKGYEMSPYTYKYHSPEEAASIAQAKQTSNGALDKPIAFGEAARATVLGGDFSPVTIQGQMNLWRDPVSTAISAAKMIRQGGAGLDDVARAEPELVARYTRATNTPFGNVSPEFSPRKSILAKIPKVGPVFSAMDEKMFGAMQRIQYESWKRNVDFVGKIYKNTPQDVIDHEVANALSKTVPGLSSVERGLSPARASVERAGLTSPSFLAAPALVVKDASSGFIKALALHPRNITGRELVAMKQLVTIAGMVEAVSLTSAVLNADNRGLSPEEAIKKALTPGDRTFLAIQAGGYTAPLGGPFRSAINGLAPKYRNGAWQAPDLLQFAKSKIAPVPGTAIDLLQNSDYYGNKIRQGDPLEQLGRVAAYIGENIGLPLTAGAVAEGVRTGRGFGETVQNALSQALGSNVNSASQYEERDVLSRKTFDGRTYSQLSNLERQQIDDAMGGKLQSTNPAVIKSQAATDTLRQANAKAQSEIDAQGPGQQWRDDYHKLQERVRGQIQDNQIRNPFTGTPYGSEMDKAIKEWGSTIDANTKGVTVNWDAVDKWMADNPDNASLVNEYMSGKKNTDLTPMVTQYKADSKAIADAGYFDVKDNIWKEIAKDDPELSKFPTYYDWRADIEKQIRGQIDPGVPPSVADGIVEKVIGKIPVTKIYTKVSNTAETGWIAEHPKIAGLAYQWGYLTPTNKERAIIASGSGQ